MRLFPNASIQRKQMFIIMLTSSAALVLACTAFVLHDWHAFRQDSQRNLLHVAERVAEKSAALPDWEDRGAVGSVLKSAVAQEPNIVMACLYQKDGKAIASYRRADQIDYFFIPAIPQKTGFHFGQNRLTLAHPIGADRETGGVVYLESDLQTLRQRSFRYAGIAGGVLVLSSIAAFFLSSRLQRLVSDPIIHLAGVAKIVSENQNYAVRAEKPTDSAGEKDELNALIGGFNEMLEQIQRRDAELQKIRSELEKRIEERTHDLVLEIRERTRAEKALQQQFARITLLNKITHSITERLDLHQVLGIVLKQLEEHLPVDLGVAFVLNAEGQLAPAAVRARQKLSPEAERKLSVKSVISLAQAGLEACAEKQTVFLPEVAESKAPLMYLLLRAELRSAIAVPLLVEEKLFGILLVARQKAGAFGSGEGEFLRMLSEQVALAAHQAKLHAELQSAYDEIRQTQHAVMQQQRLQALGQMASGIAHDINNALSPIIVYAEFVQRNEKQLAESSRRHLHNIKTAGEDIAQIVARMREFYRRREENEPVATVNINQLVAQVIELTRPRWRDIPQQKGIVVEMHTELTEDLPDIYGNASELREALTNLILNAVDAMYSGGELTIVTRLSSAVADHKFKTGVILEVHDTGLGMDEETRTRCLEPFFSTKGTRGTGLGLAMVYGIMERHEGSIEIDSQPGQGTTMRLIFPVRAARPTEGDTGRLPPVSLPAPLRILCIDDEPLLRQLLKEVLESDGHHVEVADGGQAGIDIFRARSGNGHAFDVVITDLGMPYVDGRQVASVLKKESPRIPIVLLTGWGTMMKADGDMPTQVDAIVSKPPRITELRETLLKVTTPNDPH